jgi:plastocyanin
MLSLRLAVISTILVFAIACGGNSSPSPASPSPTPSPTPTPVVPSSSVVIPVGASSLGNRAFMPGDLSITVGTTVTWMNTDSTSHTSTADGAGWNSGTLAPGRQFSFAFQTAGTFPYHCTIHPGMVGTVVVR